MTGQTLSRYRIDARIPNDAATGPGVPLVLRMGETGAPGNTGTIAVN